MGEQNLPSTSMQQNGHHPPAGDRIFLFSLSHHRAPVEIREQLTFDRERHELLLADLRTMASEAVAMTTCNRTEIYIATAEHEYSATTRLLEIVARFGEVSSQALAPVSRFEFDDRAVEHLFRVASGIDSAILGEPQILGQVRDALFDAVEHGTAGPLLQRLFQRALATGKRARSRTRIGNGAGSISHAAVQLARDTLGDLSDKRALTVGGGEMGCLVARNLVAHGVGSIEICNRTMWRAEHIAETLSGQAVPWERLGSAVDKSDIVITATGADDYVLTPEHFLNGSSRKPGMPMLIIDISVPRNVDPAVSGLPGICLFGIDDLHTVQSQGLQQRAAEVPKVQAIVREEAACFMQWYRGRQLAPVIRDLYEQAASIQSQELEKALRRLGHLSERDLEIIRTMAHGLARKLLHTPVSRMKTVGEPDAQAEHVSSLFNIQR